MSSSLGEMRLPNDPEAERAVLGAALTSAAAAVEVCSLLPPSVFYQPRHELIVVAVAALVEGGAPVDPVTVADHLTGTGSLANAGGRAYLHELASIPVSAASVAYYAGIVTGCATRRRVAQAGVRIVQDACTNTDPDDVIATAQSVLTGAVPTSGSGGPAPLAMILPEVYDTVEAAAGAAPGVRTGFPELDHVLNGFQPGQLVVVAARPGIGKSTLALDFARHAAIRDRTPTLFLSLEMTRTELGTRLVSAEAKVPLARLRSGKVDDTDWQRIAAHGDVLDGAPLYFDDSPHVTVAAVRRACTDVQRERGLGLLVVDYLQLMGGVGRVESRQQEVASITRSLKLLAKELQVPVVALSQLNRASETRPGKIPLLSDLRESGAIEQDADVVLMLHREDASDPTSPRAGEADVIVAKHRNGPTGTVTLVFQGHYSRFASMVPAR